MELMFQYFYNDTTAAIESFIKFLKLNPTFVEAQYKLANSFGLLGNKKAVIETYRRILANDPNQVRALENLALIYENKKDYHQTIQFYLTLYKLEPKNNNWLSKLITIYRTSSLVPSESTKKTWDRDLDKAFFYFQKLNKQELNKKERIDEYYNLLKEMGKFAEAKELLFDYMSINEPNKVTLRKLESIYLFLKIPFDQEKVLKEINYRRNKESAYPKILELLSQVRPNIPITLPRIAKFVDFPEGKMELLLKRLVEENPDVGEYLELEQVFIRKEDTDGIINDLKVKYSTCYYCGTPIDSIDIKQCSSCQEEILKCSICKLPISFGEEIGKCSLCEAKGHLTHMEEWVKTQGKCPICLQDLPLQGIVPLIEELKK